jgi:hypothetical protein
LKAWPSWSTWPVRWTPPPETHCLAHTLLMTTPLPTDELIAIETRLRAALSVAPAPWLPYMETREPIGGESFIALGQADAEVDNELYLEVHLGPDKLMSSDPRLDAIVDFIGHAANDVSRLLGEVQALGQRRLRS